MDMGGHNHAPVPLTPMKGHSLPIEREVQWIPKAGLEGLQVSNLLSRPGGGGNQIPWSFNVYPSPYNNRADPAPTKR